MVKIFTCHVKVVGSIPISSVMSLYFVDISHIFCLLPPLNFQVFFVLYLVFNLCIFFKQTTVAGSIELWKILSILLLLLLLYVGFFAQDFAFYGITKPYLLLNLSHCGLFSDVHLYALTAKIILTIIFVIYVLNLLFLSNTTIIHKIAPEFPIILGFSFFFTLLLQDVYDLFGAYLLLEGLALTSYLLVLVVQKSIVSVEATNKYIILTSISSGFFLFGLSILFFYTRSLHFQDLDMFLCGIFNSTDHYYSLIPIKFSLILIIFGLLIKIGVFPGHIWVPDVYAGMPILILFFFMCVTKVGIFFFFIKLITTVFFITLPLLQPILLVSAVGSIVLGALGAFNQRKLKRFIAYTSINQTGFMLLGLSCTSLSGCLASIIYLLIYIPALLLFFISLIHFSKGSGPIFLKDLFFKQYGVNTFNLSFFTIAILSMAGLPPLGGFAAKFGLFNVLINHMFFFSVTAILFSTLISSFYYLKVIRDIWFCFHKNLSFYQYSLSPYTFYNNNLYWFYFNWRFGTLSRYLHILLNTSLFLFLICFYMLQNHFIFFCTLFAMSAFDDYFFMIY